MGGMENSRKTINHHQLGHVGMTHHILQLKLSNDNASDLEEHGNPLNMAPQSSSGSRWNPTADQVTILKELYKAGMRTPTAEQIQQISSQLRRYGKIEGKNVFYWFQNHKARERQKRRRCDNNNVLQKPETDSDTWITEEEESSSPQLYGNTAYTRDSHNSRHLYPKEMDTSQSYRDGISKWVHGFRQEFHYNSHADNTNNLNRGTHGDHGIDGSAVFRTQKGHISVEEVGGTHEPETLQLFPVKYEGRSHEKPDCNNCSSWLHSGNNYWSSDVNGKGTNKCSTKDPLDLSLSCLCE